MQTGGSLLRLKAIVAGEEPEVIGTTTQNNEAPVAQAPIPRV
jgi:hypothetical protein